MQNKREKFFFYILISAAILVATFFISLFIHSVFDAKELIAPLFVLAVFLVAMFTDGYIYGTCAALISMLAVNYAFAFPYFAFNFTIQENIISAIILMVVTTATSTLTTKIKSQEKTRLQAEKEKMRADLLRSVSHDLRTPLTAIYGSASTVTENYSALTDEKKQEILSGIQKDSMWLIRMVENLLSITRIDNSNVTLHKSPVVIEELVDSCLAKLKKNYPRYQITLDMPDEFLTVLADALLVEQVIINLLENAILHAKGMTELRLKIYVRESKAIFEVSDDGCGIEKERLKTIFSGYYTTDEFRGDSGKRCMGIGLSACSAIISAHGEKIFAENNRKGGARFWFSLELEDDDNE